MYLCRANASKMVMKKLTLILTLLVCTVLAQAEPVTLEDAARKAANFLSAASHAAGDARSFAPARRPQTLQAVDVQYPFYVFNVGEDDGFVLVSGDTRTSEVLGFVDHGRFDADRMPDNMRAWLDSYAEQLRWLVKQPEEVAANAVRRAPAKVAVKNPISPLMTTLWNQSSPYNQKCPVSMFGSRCVTGCIATALAQIMNYHQWPDTVRVNIPGYTLHYSNGDIKVDSLFAPIRFDWANMQSTYQGTETKEQLETVATLMAAAGTASSMQFGSAASSSNSMGALKALKRYFDYSSQAHYESRYDYLMEEWNDLIYGELSAGRPVLYTGSTSANEGHAFVVDGFSSGNLFHVNWGWGGFCDGYFLLSILNPGSSQGIGASSAADGYALTQSALVGVKKNEGEAPFEPLQLEADIVGIRDHTVLCSFNNNRVFETDTFDIALGMLRADGTYAPLNQRQVVLPLNKYYPEIPFDVDGLADGTYQLVPISKVMNGRRWTSTLNPARTHVRADVADGNITLTLVCPQPQLSATIDLVGTHLMGDKHSVRVRVENTGDEFNNLVYLFADTLRWTAPRGQETLVLPRGDSRQIAFDYTPAYYNIPADSSLSVRMAVATDRAGTNIVADTVFVFAGGEPKNVVRSDSLAIRMEGELTPVSDDGVYLLGKDANLKLRLINSSDTTYVGNYGFRIHYVYPLVGTAYYYYSSYQNSYTLAAHSTDEVSINLLNQTKFDLPVGQEFYLELIYTYKGAQWKTAFLDDHHYIVAPAVKKYKADGSVLAEPSVDTCFVAADITAVDLRQAERTKVVMGGNPNTLYYVDAEAETLPEGISVNVVRGNVADSIRLRDGFDFVPPMKFTARHIAYSRTFQRGFHRDSVGGWNSLVLPFAVTSVEVAEPLVTEDTTLIVPRPIDWYRSASDTGKDFWIMQFDDEEGRNMWFEPINRFVANRPYLIIVPEDTTSASLVGKPITFYGSNAAIVPGASLESTGHTFIFRGSRAYQTGEGIYALDAQGTQFVRTDTVVQAFRAFFTPVKSSFFNNLTIVTDAQLDAVPAVRPDSVGVPGDDHWYTIDGRRIATPTRSGLYLHRGRKKTVR